jgi:hypothetical protein
VLSFEYTDSRDSDVQNIEQVLKHSDKFRHLTLQFYGHINQMTLMRQCGGHFARLQSLQIVLFERIHRDAYGERYDYSDDGSDDEIPPEAYEVFQCAPDLRQLRLINCGDTLEPNLCFLTFPWLNLTEIEIKDIDTSHLLEILSRVQNAHKITLRDMAPSLLIEASDSLTMTESKLVVLPNVQQLHLTRPGGETSFLQHLKCPALARVEIGLSEGALYQPIIDMVRISACSITTLKFHTLFDAQDAGILAYLQSLPTLESITLKFFKTEIRPMKVYPIFDALINSNQD